MLVWAGVPFAPEERAPRNLALAIKRWREAARALPPLSSQGEIWPLAQLPPLPILSLDPTGRVEAAFRQAGVPLNVVCTRRDLPARDRHNLLKLGGDLATRAGLLLSWDDVRAASNDSDKAHLLQEAGRLVQDGVVLVLAPSPSAVFARLWRELLFPALRGAVQHFVLGPADFAWPAPLVRLEVAPEEAFAALAGVAVSPLADQSRVAFLRLQLAEARANLRLVEERESAYVLNTDVPLQLVKEKQQLQRRIVELEAELLGLATFPEA